MDPISFLVAFPLAFGEPEPAKPTPPPAAAVVAPAEPKAKPQPAPVVKIKAPEPETPVMAWHNSGTYPGQQVYGYIRPDGMIQPAGNDARFMRPIHGYIAPPPTVTPPAPRYAPAPVYYQFTQPYCATGNCSR